MGRRAGAPRAWTTGLQSGSFGWVYDDPRGAALLPRTFGMHALIEVPPTATGLAGVLTVQTAVTGGSSLSAWVEFDEPFRTGVTAGAAAMMLMSAGRLSFNP